VRAIAECLLGQFLDLRITIETMMAKADTMVVRTLSEGTNLEVLNGVILPTGTRFSLDGATGSKSQRTSWSSTGRRVRIFPPCRRWRFFNLQVGPFLEGSSYSPNLVGGAFFGS
jgi:hypothetical protein